MLGSGELLIILLLILFLFGGKKLPELARSLGEGIREFKKACNGFDQEEVLPKKTPSPEEIAPLSTTNFTDKNESTLSS